MSLFGLGVAWALRKENYEYLQQEERRRNSARLQGLTECVRCGYCCIQRTCVPTPDEISGIAEYLKLSVEELITQYMVGDTIQGHYFLRFANIEQKDLLGEFLPDYRTYDKGPCLLMVQHDSGDCECRIFPIRPKDVEESCCWKWGEEDDEYSAIKQWKEGDLQELCLDMDIEDFL